MKTMFQRYLVVLLLLTASHGLSFTNEVEKNLNQAMNGKDYDRAAAIILGEKNKSNFGKHQLLIDLFKRQDKQLESIAFQVADLQNMLSLQSQANNDVNSDIHSLASSMGYAKEENEKLEKRVKELEEQLAAANKKLEQSN